MQSQGKQIKRTVSRSRRARKARKKWANLPKGEKSIKQEDTKYNKGNTRQTRKGAITDPQVKGNRWKEYIEELYDKEGEPAEDQLAIGQCVEK